MAPSFVVKSRFAQVAMGSMSKLAFLCSLLVASPLADEEINVAALDDECAEGSCALGLLQKDSTEDRRNWIRLIEGNGCPQGGPIPCEKIGNTRHFKFPAGVFTLHRQVTVPANTIIEGVSNPNDAGDKTRKPDYAGQTVFEATVGVSDHNICYCQNLERSWEPLSPRNPYHCTDLTNKQVQRLRPGFLMYSNTKVKNIAYQGKDTLRPSDNGALCGGAVFETPGCVHNQCLFPHLKTGDGRPVSNVRIENVRMNDYAGDPNLASQLAVWVAQTTDTGTPTRDVVVKNLVAMFLHADGINFHGFVQDAMVDDSYIQNTGDDIYAVWGSHFDTRNIVFQNCVGVDAGRARQNHYGQLRRGVRCKGGNLSRPHLLRAAAEHQRLLRFQEQWRDLQWLPGNHQRKLQCGLPRLSVYLFKLQILQPEAVRGERTTDLRFVQPATHGSTFGVQQGVAPRWSYCQH